MRRVHIQLKQRPLFPGSFVGDLGDNGPFGVLGLLKRDLLTLRGEEPNLRHCVYEAKMPEEKQRRGVVCRVIAMQ